MSVVRCPVYLVVLTFLWTSNRGDAEICVFNNSCILPCSFQPGDEVVIHWIQVNGKENTVHSYYHGQDQLAYQDQRFKARTSLFRDQISKGNASLRLTGVQFQDEGRYKCYTSTITGNHELFIYLNVEAPVRKVHIQQAGNSITCSSEGIYPEPKLTWSTNPPTNFTFKERTKVQQTEQRLYSISSSLIRSDGVTDLTYSCTVSTGRNSRTTLFKETSISGSGGKTTIPCGDPKSAHTGLIWRFNHSQIVLSQTRADVSYTASAQWREHVKDVSASGSLTLKDLSSDQEGTYTCELSDDDETYITNTFLKMVKSQGTSHVIGGVIGALVVLILGVLVVLFIKYKERICQKFKKTQTTNNDKQTTSGEEEEVLPLKNLNNEEKH
ncbi:CD276 antigen [Pagrus major]|uniref:CD276 antigen n=1 Tax=Pagrus major TaxID=143350 RepID=UPI003CC88F11